MSRSPARHPFQSSKQEFDDPKPTKTAMQDWALSDPCDQTSNPCTYVSRFDWLVSAVPRVAGAFCIARIGSQGIRPATYISMYPSIRMASVSQHIFISPLHSTPLHIHSTLHVSPVGDCTRLLSNAAPPRYPPPAMSCLLTTLPLELLYCICSRLSDSTLLTLTTTGSTMHDLVTPILEKRFYKDRKLQIDFMLSPPIRGTDKFHGTALHWAAFHSRASMITRLLEDPAIDVDCSGWMYDRFDWAKRKMTPLCLAARSGDEATIKCLLRHGAKIGWPTPIDVVPQDFVMFYVKSNVVAGWVGEEGLRRAKKERSKKRAAAASKKV